MISTRTSKSILCTSYISTPFTITYTALRLAFLKNNPSKTTKQLFSKLVVHLNNKTLTLSCVQQLIVNTRHSQVQGRYCAVLYAPSWVFSSISCSSTKSTLLMPHAVPNFSKKPHITAKLGSFSQVASLSDAIFNLSL